VESVPLLTASLQTFVHIPSSSFQCIFWSHAQDAFVITEEVKAKVKSNCSGSLELKLVLLFQYIHKLLQISHSNCQIININSNILIDSVLWAHPNVWLSLAWKETFSTQAV
jgi:hypothetical protein